MELDKYGESLLSAENAQALRKLSESETGRRVAGMMDETALRNAMQTGDSDALQAALHKILSTPEGRALAAEVKKAVDGR